jgi:small-conductance mechanosensitive channel
MRLDHIAYQLSLFVVLASASYAIVEVLLTLFAEAVPHLRGAPPATPITKDILRTVMFLAIFLLTIKLAFPRADIGAVLTTSAILSLVIGLALQESLSNVFAGIMLSVEQPYKPGDWVEIDGREGKVIDSNWRSTRLLTREDDLIYVPNSVMAKQIVVNVSAPTVRHLCRRRLSIEYGAQPNRVRAVLVAMMSHIDGVLKEPAPDAFVLEYADFAVVYELRFWIEDLDRRPRIENEVMRACWYHLRRNGIKIPFPVRDVVVRRPAPDGAPAESLELFRKVDILQSLDADDVKMLAEDATHQLYARGEVVCRQGEPGSTFYIVRSGSIGVRVRGDGGAEAEVAQIRAGGYFGEMSLLTGEPRSSTCAALEDSDLVCLDRETFSVLLSENPSVAQKLSQVLASRQLALQEKLAKNGGAAAPTPQMEETRTRILEKIWRMFRFRY